MIVHQLKVYYLLHVGGFTADYATLNAQHCSEPDGRECLIPNQFDALLSVANDSGLDLVYIYTHLT